jgi:hypothetical protein
VYACSSIIRNSECLDRTRRSRWLFDDVGIILLRETETTDIRSIEHFSVQEMSLIELDRSITRTRMFHSKAPSFQIQITESRSGQVMSLRSLQQAMHVPVAWKDTQRDIICSLTSTQKGKKKKSVGNIMFLWLTARNNWQQPWKMQCKLSAV